MTENVNESNQESFLIMNIIFDSILVRQDIVIICHVHKIWLSEYERLMRLQLKTSLSGWLLSALVDCKGG